MDNTLLFVWVLLLYSAATATTTGYTANQTTILTSTISTSTSGFTSNLVQTTSEHPVNTTSNSCGGFLTRSSGSFSSPSYPRNYSQNIQCVWSIKISNNDYIRLTFQNLNLGDSNNCLSDYIEVYDGPLYTSPLLGRICYGSNYSFTSTSNTMTVLFSSVSGYSAGGFSAYYYSVPENNNDTALTCSGEYMHAVVNRTYLLSLGYYAWDVHMKDPSCVPQFTENYIIFNIPLAGCGTVKEQGINNTIIYSNVITASLSDDVIVREKDFVFHMTCRMNEDAVAEIKYVAKDTIYINETQYGKFDVNISFFETSYFLNQVSASPYYVDLDQDLFLQATLYSSDPNLMIFIDTCVASPYPDDFRNLNYVLINSGCPVDPTYDTYYSPNSTIARFKFNAFKFLNRHSEVYLQCQMVICSKNDPSSRCYQGCLSRYKRDTSSYQKKMDVIVGPVQLERKTEDTKLGSDNSVLLGTQNIHSPFFVATLFLVLTVLVLTGILLRSKLKGRNEHQLL